MNRNRAEAQSSQCHQLQLIEEELGYLEERNQLPTRKDVEQRFSWWALETALTPEQLESVDDVYRQRGMLPDDTASYFLNDDAQLLRSCAVWRSFDRENVKRALYSGLNMDSHVPQQVRLQKLHMFERSRHPT